MADLHDDTSTRVGDGPSGSSALRARLGFAARVLVSVSVVAAVAYSVVTQWSDVRGAITQVAWQSLTLALAAILAGMACNVMAYRNVLHSLGTDVPAATAGRVFLVGQLGKYLPGSVWAYVLQMELGRRAGIARATAFVGALVVTGLALVAALALGVLGLPALADAGRPTVVAILLVTPFALVCAHPKVLTRLVDLFLRLIRKVPLSQPFAWRGVSRAVLWSALGWVCFGAQLWLLVNAMTGPGVGGFVRCVGAFSLAMTAGLLAFLVPSGIGAREAVLVAALSAYTTPGVALGLALVSRLLFTIGDVLAAGGAAAWGRWMLRRSPAPSPAGTAT